MSEQPAGDEQTVDELDEHDREYLATHEDEDDPDTPDEYEGDDEGDAGHADESGGAA